MKSQQLYSRLRNFLPFMEPKVLLKCSQNPFIGSYPRPNEFSPHSENLLISKVHFNIILPKDILISSFLTKILYVFINFAMCATCPNSNYLDLLNQTEQDHETKHTNIASYLFNMHETISSCVVVAHNTMTSWCQHSKIKKYL